MAPNSLEARVVVAIALAFTALTISSASALVVAGKAPKLPNGYHIDGFRGWRNGYPVGLRGCAPFDRDCRLLKRPNPAI